MPENQDSSSVRGLKLTAPRSLYFMIFAISGFSGLIYESIWSHYLKLFLGHAAYAQSLVLINIHGWHGAGIVACQPLFSKEQVAAFIVCRR